MVSEVGVRRRAVSFLFLAFLSAGLCWAASALFLLAPFFCLSCVLVLAEESHVVFFLMVDWEQCVLVCRGRRGPVRKLEQLLKVLMYPMLISSLGVVVVFVTLILRYVMY